MGMEIKFEVGAKPKKVDVVGAEVIEKKDNYELEAGNEVGSTEASGSIPKVKVTLKPLESFTEKDNLESYGLTFGINLNKSKKVENMYADLVAHVNK